MAEKSSREAGDRAKKAGRREGPAGRREMQTEVGGRRQASSREREMGNDEEEGRSALGSKIKVSIIHNCVCFDQIQQCKHIFASRSGRPLLVGLVNNHL